MKKPMSRYIGGIGASLFLVFALSASQPSPVCAAVGGDCDYAGLQYLKCTDDFCCTYTKGGEICDCEGFL